MAIDGRKLVNYLAYGIPESQIATALNVDRSRISQLKSDDRVRNAVEERKKEIALEGMTEVADLGTIKKSLIRRMKDLADSTDSLTEAANALEKIDKMTATRLGRDEEQGGVRQVIMQAPIFIQQAQGSRVEIDSKKRVVSISGRSMAQMPTEGVLEILQGEHNVAMDN